MTTRSLLTAVLLTLCGLVVPESAAQAKAEPTIVVTVGTSIPAGVGVGSAASWPERLEDRTGLDVEDRSLGGGSYTMENEYGDTIRKHVDAAIAEFADFENKVMILDAPVNDLVYSNDTGDLRWAVHYADEAATAAGWHVVAQAIYPFNDCAKCAFPTGWWGSLEPRRQSYNTWGAQHFAGRWTDPSPWLKETSSARGDQRWYSDGLHPVVAAHGLIADTFPLRLLAA